eukprot:SAG31_NODE_27440_length_426_cov_0.636086_1_plen_27_part_10
MLLVVNTTQVQRVRGASEAWQRVVDGV